MKKIVIFDLDGTLFDTTYAMQACGNHALSFFGFPGFSREQYARFSGGGVEEYVNAILEGRPMPYVLIPSKRLTVSEPVWIRQAGDNSFIENERCIFPGYLYCQARSVQVEETTDRDFFCCLPTEIRPRIQAS